ncbi:unnamed protein product [Porites evermanni]|uniref:BRCT domain-containing protein n=1 Tax=Porites evermanni TaxID=104178 RepID=A0ABN8MS40_9CNID|nr:unnamed protein product [Porites evermanni]
MPLIRPRHVLSFSSEDVAQPAQNLLKSETYRKWRCASAGEKQASIILELERAMRIHSIDIGNNGSALVEVLVGRSSWSSNEQYQVLLVASSFMSPAESKSFTNINRVRMFGPDKLSKPVAAQKWDRIKLVCTQPFNKNEQYGLSFINLHSPPEDTDEGDVKNTTISSPSVANPASKRLGRFTLKDDSDSEEKSISSGSLFFKKRQKKASLPPMSMAAEVRAASTATASSSDDKRTSDTSGFKATKDRQSVPSDRQPVALNRHVEAKEKKEKSRTTSPKPEQKSAERRISESTKRKYEDLPKENSRGKSPPPSKRKRESVNKDNDSQVTFGEIMKDVVFVMSGFVNPERGNLRDKALQMGAQFKQDWGRGCTHLICAFANTPKFNQVKGKGKIVTKKWITDCFKKNRRLPTRDYHLPGDSSSSDESCDEKDINTTRSVKTTTSTERGERKRAGSKSYFFLQEETSPVSDKCPIGKNTQTSESAETKDEPKKANDADEIYGGSTDDESAELNQSKEIEHVAPPRSKEVSSSSDLDTEDELKRSVKYS